MTKYNVMKLASIETIASISPHSNADRLEIATVLGWQAVVKKGEFKAGDRCVFVVIDTILPKASWSDFLADPKRSDKPIRLNTVRLRGEYSQGLVLPVSLLPEHMQTWQEGADVGTEIGVKKYEKELPKSLGGVAKCSFPLHLAPKTDEDNGNSVPRQVELTLEQPVIVTLKLDGSSCTVIVGDCAIVDVCSRNLSLVESEGNGFWHVARKLDLSKATGRWVIQGELMGPGIQGNQLGLLEPTLYVFQIKDVESGKWLGRDRLEQVCKDMGVLAVPVLLHAAESTSPDFYRGLADMVCLPLPKPDKPAEGIVVRNDPPRQHGSGRPLGFKIINRNYKDAA